MINRPLYIEPAKIVMPIFVQPVLDESLGKEEAEIKYNIELKQAEDDYNKALELAISEYEDRVSLAKALFEKQLAAWEALNFETHARTGEYLQFSRGLPAGGIDYRCWKNPENGKMMITWAREEARPTNEEVENWISISNSNKLAEKEACDADMAEIKKLAENDVIARCLLRLLR